MDFRVPRVSVLVSILSQSCRNTCTGPIQAEDAAHLLGHLIEEGLLCDFCRLGSLVLEVCRLRIGRV